MSSTPKASPYGSPKRGSVNKASSASSTPKALSRVSSPCKALESGSPHRKGSGSVSPPSRIPGSVSGGRIPTSRSSSSKTSTPSSSAKSSPHKVNSLRRSPSQSPSKVPLSKSASSQSNSPSKEEKKQIESTSSSAATKPSKNKSLLESSTEDERVLAEILFHRETDSSGEASDHQKYLARQQTITLTSQDDDTSKHEKVEPVVSDISCSSSLQRQNTVTLSKTDESELALNKDDFQESVSLDADQEVDKGKDRDAEVPGSCSSEDLKSSVRLEDEVRV
ncbi:hypothetical protein SK128_023458 [Halocaridina rubra]|uniref:Uncharacterized protein n=1 Tax=Halocaridina rubra TaxID=373956 RepID=A0AAN8XN27_HALRR